jgi:DNA-binding Lrp family transcriptional regulator
MHNDGSQLDDFDRRILARYQRATRIPAADIGSEIGLSGAAVQRRLKRLRESGVIEAEAAQLSPAALGFPVTCLVGVDLRDESTLELDRFKARMLERAEVQQCYYVTGQWDFMLVVLAQSMEAYEALTREALLSDPNVQGFTTHVVLDRVKVGMDLPIGK